MNNSQEPGHERSRVVAGAIVLGIGVLFLIRQAGWAIFPYWLFSWPMILIAIGVYVGVKHNFRGAGWLVMLILGTFFLADDVLDAFPLRDYLVPALLIGIGAMIILRPKRNRPWNGFNGVWSSNTPNSAGPQSTNTPRQESSNYSSWENTTTDASDRMDATAIFGSVKKNIVSKNFQGGEATSIFGGSEIDLSQADINGTVRLDVTAILGGVKLIIPSHWAIRQEVTAIFGGVEDKRDMYNVVPAQNKILILEGTAFMGGIEIKSYR